ncbi:putative transcription factor bZIP family [Helianthus annuus]|nr:putative transcription factor bZIP family [Helianthus annuus]KAJ0595998.1 putative transcription factor bZIP family [Helianthus annuus]KAJ0756640.1 putative transcription factor bZIP family [Helianthus annuus]KAJ0760388.1 putative transcription factor bZIP family [Helianthus annuus]KAJ0925641.1 putative transcription factor bZIP family [Helianthus annuus]
MNYKNFGNQPAAAAAAAEVGGGGARPPGSFHLARQGSIYSLTFDELQNTMGSSIGKDFGSMNMDELLKSIWNAEEVQTTGNNAANGVQEGGSGDGGGVIQRQGSLTLPRTLSQKTVDEVWKDISKEFHGFGQPNLPQRQQTLGEMTLEEFLVKAGVVREETQAQLANNPNDNGLFSNLTNSQNSPGFGTIGFQQGASRNAVVNVNVNNSNQIAFQSSNLPLNVNGVRSTAQNPQLFPKQTNISYGAPMTVPSSKPLGSPVIRNGIMGVSDPMMNNNIVSSGALQGGVGGMVGLGVPGAVAVTVGSPAVSSDGMGKNNGDTSSVSPSPYEFTGIVRGRRSGTVEKVVERRQRRMIKNRESAARSRARKQAYTMELEAEVAKLKEQNQELKRKAEMMEKQQNQVIEMMSTQPGAKRRNLRRTLSGPW